MKKIFSFLITLILISTFACSVYATQQARTSLHINTKEQAYMEFKAGGLVPGDLIKQKVKLMVEHNANSKITVSFVVDEDSSQELFENFDIKVYVIELDKIIYNGKIKDLTGKDLFVEYSNDIETINYDFEIFLPTEVGNECANKTLSGKFVWTAETVGEVPDGGDVVVPPQTGDNSKIWIYISVSAVAILGIFGIISLKRKGG